MNYFNYFYIPAGVFRPTPTNTNKKKCQISQHQLLGRNPKNRYIILIVRKMDTVHYDYGKGKRFVS